MIYIDQVITISLCNTRAVRNCLAIHLQPFAAICSHLKLFEAICSHLQAVRTWSATVLSVERGLRDDFNKSEMIALKCHANGRLSLGAPAVGQSMALSVRAGSHR